MKLSVIIPYMEAFEGKQQILERCLNSLNGVDEIIVVDNWKAGYAVPINFGLSQATGDFMLVMNDDIWRTRGYLKDLCDPEAVTSPYEDGGPAKSIWGNCFCLPRWVYEKTGGLDERYRISYYDDEDLIFTLNKLEIPMRSVDSVEFTNPEGGTTLHTFPDHNEFFEENKQRFFTKMGKIAISVISPTVRLEGLDLVQKALKRQTFTDYEWIVASPTPPGNHNCHWVKDPKKKKGDYWSVYTAYNNLIRKASGELIVTVQDYTFFNADGLEKFWYHYQNEPKTIVSGVGNKYEDDTWAVKTWQDPRERDDQGTFYQCFYNDIELNYSAFPREAFYSVGGFDEYLNKYSSLCGLDVLDRLNIQGGWDFKLDQTNKSYSLEHGRLPKWDENLPFNGPYEERRRAYLANCKLDYLK